MERFDAAQIEQLKEIGTYLRQMREERSVSLDEISTKTYVPMRMLRALENAQFDILPEPVFVRGFIRRYADALGLDGLGIAKSFPLQPTPAAPSIPLPEVATTPAQPASSSGVEQIRFARSSRGRSLSFTPLFLVLGAIAVGGVAYALIVANDGSRPTTSQTATPSADPSPAATPSAAPAPSAEVSPSPTASPSPIASPSPTASPSPVASGPITVDLRFSGASWVRVRVDGQVAYEGTLPQGTQRRWSGQREVTVRAGNAGAVSVALNEGAAQPMGQPGQVANQTFTADAEPATPTQ